MLKKAQRGLNMSFYFSSVCSLVFLIALEKTNLENYSLSGLSALSVVIEYIVSFSVSFVVLEYGVSQS